MRFKVDEDLPKEVADLLRAGDHDAVTVRGEKLTGFSDDILWAHVQREQRCLVTADKGFGDIRAFPAGTHGGIVLFRHPRESRMGYARLTQKFVEGADWKSVVGSIVVVTPEAIRVHRRT